MIMPSKYRDDPLEIFESNYRNLINKLFILELLLSVIITASNRHDLASEEETQFRSEF